MKSISSRVLRNVVVTFFIIGLVLLSLGGALRPFLGIIMDPFVMAQRWLSERFMAVYDFFTLPRDVTELLQRNAKLENEVSHLQSQLIQLQEQLVWLNLVLKIVKNC